MTSDPGGNAAFGSSKASSAIAPGAVADEKVNILIVDDRADKLLALETALTELNENIVLARSGKDALRCLLRWLTFPGPRSGSTCAATR